MTVDHKEEHKIDFRVPGLSHSVVKEAEHLRVQELGHFGSSHFCSNLRCSRVEAGCGVLFLLISVRRRRMPRRRWLPAPDEWVQIIRGPRPPSMKWPSATVTRQSSNTVKKQGDVGGAQRPEARGRWRQPPARVSPEVSQEAAQKRAAQLEGALKAFGDTTGPEVTMIQESLKSAKRAVHVPPLTVQVSQCEQFIARAQKRLVAHDEERILLVKQLEDGQQRLHSFREQVSQSAAPVHPPPDWGAQVASLQQMVNAL